MEVVDGQFWVFWRRWQPGLAVATTLYGGLAIALLVHVATSTPVGIPPSLSVELLPGPPALQPRPDVTPPQPTAPSPNREQTPPMSPIALAPASPRNDVVLPPPKPPVPDRPTPPAPPVTAPRRKLSI